MTIALRPDARATAEIEFDKVVARLALLYRCANAVLLKTECGASNLSSIRFSSTTVSSWQCCKPRKRLRSPPFRALRRHLFARVSPR